MYALIRFAGFLFIIIRNSYGEICSNGSLPCDTSGCIPSSAWCNYKVDCRDYSDERYCAYNKTRFPCKDVHFQCVDRSCIPLVGLCNGIQECPDGSDEKCPDEISRQTAGSLKVRRESVLNEDVFSFAAQKVLRWLLNKRNKDHGWGKFTPRASTAYELIRKSLPAHDMKTTEKQLKIQTAMEVLKEYHSSGGSLMLASELAIFINALIATCQNPRNFNEKDLVDILRKKIADKENGRISPSVYLSLCLCNHTEPTDFKYVYENANERSPDILAIGAMALVCMTSRNADDQLLEMAYQMLQKAVQKVSVEMISPDIYTTALVVQAINSGKRLPGFEDRFENRTALRNLLLRQIERNEIVDILAAYYAVPAVIGKSLLDVRNICEGSLESFTLPHVNKIGYTLWIKKKSRMITHSTELFVGRNWTLFDVMKFAKSKSKIYDFRYEVNENGIGIYSISGIPNDSEKDLYWRLIVNPQYKNGDIHKVEEFKSFDKLEVHDGDSFLFVYAPYNTEKNSFKK